MHDPIADLLTRIRNAAMALHPSVTVPHSRMKEAISRILQKEGYVSSVEVEGTAKKSLKIGLKYQGRRNVIVGLKQVSTPGLRRYVGVGDIPRVLGGMGVAILSTPKGILSGGQARREGVGGEVVCYVW